MKNSIKIAGFAFLLVVMSISCKKDKYPDPVQVTKDVYAIGVDGYEYTKYWKNGISTILPYGQGISGGYAELTSIYVSGTDVYVVGIDRNPDQSLAKLWKNGKETILAPHPNTDYSSTGAWSVFVSGKDVYVAGYELIPDLFDPFASPLLWKNGLPTKYFPLYHSGSAHSVFVSGPDVYVAGQDENKQAVLWKNGIAAVQSSHGIPYSIFVSGTDVYVAGDGIYPNNRIAKLWKNNAEYNLTDNTHFSGARSVFVSGEDVYVIGYEDDASGKEIAKLWKNGTESSLIDGKNKVFNAVFVSDNDVYVAGREGNVGKYWKNGIATNLTDVSEYGYINSIFVK